jgi:hypothetical protein
MVGAEVLQVGGVRLESAYEQWTGCGQFQFG